MNIYMQFIEVPLQLANIKTLKTYLSFWKRFLRTLPLHHRLTLRFYLYSRLALSFCDPSFSILCRSEELVTQGDYILNIWEGFTKQTELIKKSRGAYNKITWYSFHPCPRIGQGYPTLHTLQLHYNYIYGITALASATVI